MTAVLQCLFVNQKDMGSNSILHFYDVEQIGHGSLSFWFTNASSGAVEAAFCTHVLTVWHTELDKFLISLSSACNTLNF